MHRPLGILQWVAVIASGSISLAAALHDTQGKPGVLEQGLLAELVRGGNDLKWLAPGLVAVAVALGRARLMIGPPWVWTAIQRVLDRYHEPIFGRDKPQNRYRITLFKYSHFVWWVWPWRSRFWPWGYWRFPWSGWLIPVRRTGGSDKRSKTIFFAHPDDPKPEWIAGQAWTRRAFVRLPPEPKADEEETLLPELYGPSYESLEQHEKESCIEEYANRTFVSVDWVKRRMREGKLCPRWLWGTCIEASVSKKYWGVIVIESEGPFDFEHVYNEGKRLSGELGTLVEGL